MMTGEWEKATKPPWMRRNIVRPNEAKGAGGIGIMDFVDRVVDLGAQEINVTGVAGIERISKGQVRITYFTRRKGEQIAAVHLIWDIHEWLGVWRVWEDARDSILRECTDYALLSIGDRRREAH